MNVLLAALPGIARTPATFQRSAPISASEIGFVLVGLAVMVIFGITIAAIWSRLNAREARSAKRGT
jgi:hypothetical protein